MAKEKQLIIGLGSGRSGTVSLAHLLNSQPNSYFIHEGFFRENPKHVLRMYGDLLPWNIDALKLDTFLDKLEIKSGDSRMYGCVASYFLPYVEIIHKKVPSAVFICLKRDKEETIQSFKLKSGKNHWSQNADVGSSIWDMIHPKYDTQDIDEALGNYWDEYYAKASQLAQKYPEHFKVFPIDVLNTEAGLNELLDFAQFPKDNRTITPSKAYNSNTNSLVANFKDYLSL